MKQRILSLTCIVAILAPSVRAQDPSGYRFESNFISLNRAFTAPEDLSPKVCNTTINASDANSLLENKYCTLGVAHSQTMAIDYAEAAGKYLGCIDGYFDGLEKGYNAGYVGVDTVTLSKKFDGKDPIGEAVTIGAQKAKSAVLTDVAGTIVKRHRDAVRTNLSDAVGTIDEKSDFKKDNYTYQGYPEGHKFIYKSFWKDLATEYGSHSMSLDDQLKYKYLKDNNMLTVPCDLGTAKFFLVRNSVQSGYYTNFNYFDYFYYQEKVDFARYGWKDASWAWDFFVRENPNFSYTATIKSINELVEPVTTTTKVEKTRYVPVPNSNPVTYTEEKYFEDVTKTTNQPLSQARRDALIAQYKKGFIESYTYQDGYAESYARKGYYTNAESTFKIAINVGKGIGKYVAENITEINAYNKVFQSDSRSAYDREVEKKYNEKFAELFNVFKTSGVFELNAVSLSDSNNGDLIYRANEAVYPNITITNLGQKSGDAFVELSSEDFNPSSVKYVFNVDNSFRKEFKPTNGSFISNDVTAPSIVNYSINVAKNKKLLDVAENTINTKDTHEIAINDYAEVQDVALSINENSGNVTADVTIYNSSKNTSAPERINSKLGVEILSGFSKGKAVVIDVGPIDPLHSTPKTVELSGIDPLVIIDAMARGTDLEVQAYTEIAGRKVSTKTVAVRLPQVDVRALYTKYLVQLINGDSKNYGNQDRNDRIGNIKEKLYSFINAEVENRRIKWHKAKFMNRTTVKILSSIYESEKIRRNGSVNQAEFDSIARDLAKKSPEIRPRGIFNNKRARKAYLNELAKISPALKASL